MCTRTVASSAQVPHLQICSSTPMLRFPPWLFLTVFQRPISPWFYPPPPSILRYISPKLIAVPDRGLFLDRGLPVPYTHSILPPLSCCCTSLRTSQPTHKRARVTCVDGHDAVLKRENPCVADKKVSLSEECSAAPQQPTWHDTQDTHVTSTTSPEKTFGGSPMPSPVHRPLPPVPETPSSTVWSSTGVVVVPEASCPGSWRTGGRAGGASPRPPSPTPSSTSSSTFSAATTSATMSSRGASLSSCRSWMRGSSARGASSASSSWGGGGSVRSFSHPTLSSSSGSDFFPAPSLWDEGRRRRGCSGRRDRSCSRESERSHKHRRWSSRDYASEAEGSGRGGRRYSGRKRSRGGGGGVECSRCMEWCRGSREQKAITRTLPVRIMLTPEHRAPLFYRNICLCSPSSRTFQVLFL